MVKVMALAMAFALNTYQGLELPSPVESESKFFIVNTGAELKEAVAQLNDAALIRYGYDNRHATLAVYGNETGISFELADCTCEECVAWRESWQ